jgi:hypothetical protein
MPTTHPRTLGQLIAVERGLRQEDNRIGSDIRKALSKEALVTGLIKTYHPFADQMDGERAAFQDVPDQYTAVQHRVEDDLDLAMQHAITAMDVVASKDHTNCDAKADVRVGDNVLATGVPISHLLWLQKYLGEWRSFLSELPVIKPDKEWTYDTEDRVWKSREEETLRPVKEVVPVVMYPATDKHPAQVQAVSKDIPIGKYRTVTLSGAISPKRKRELLDNINMVLLAVKDAIAVANRTPAVEVKEGEKILGFILGR